MNTFVLRHVEAFKRVSLAMLAFGLGHYALRFLGTTGGILAASMIAGFGALMLAYLWRFRVPLDHHSIESPPLE
jgi:hypothetical protein